MASGSPPADLYRLLGISPDASAAEITRAYRRKARLLHPDARPGESEGPAGFGAVAEAYQVLGDPGRRAAYDQARQPDAGGPGPLPHPGARPPAAWPGPPAAWLTPPARPGGFPAGAALWAGPARIDPPGRQASENPRAAEDLARGRLAMLAQLLARYLGDFPGPAW